MEIRIRSCAKQQPDKYDSILGHIHRHQLTVFGAASSQVYAACGFFVWPIAILALIAALVARTNRLNIGWSLLAALPIMPVQGILVHTEFSIPALHALHAVNGLANLYLSYTCAGQRPRAGHV